VSLPDTATWAPIACPEGKLAPSKMVALQAAPEESGDSAFFKSSLALTDAECLEAVAFTHTLVTTP
jgi:hypothetical protein